MQLGQNRGVQLCSQGRVVRKRLTQKRRLLLTRELVDGEQRDRLRVPG